MEKLLTYWVYVIITYKYAVIYIIKILWFHSL